MLPKKIEIKVRKIVKEDGEVIFWVVWDFIVDGEKRKSRHDTCFPFSMS